MYSARRIGTVSWSRPNALPSEDLYIWSPGHQGVAISGALLSCYLITWWELCVRGILYLTLWCICLPLSAVDRKQTHVKMALHGGRGFLVQPCFPISNHICKPSLGVTNKFWPARRGITPRLTLVRAQLRPTWLPGLDPPPYLDGRLAPSCKCPWWLSFVLLLD